MLGAGLDCNCNHWISSSYSLCESWQEQDVAFCFSVASVTSIQSPHFPMQQHLLPHVTLRKTDPMSRAGSIENLNLEKRGLRLQIQAVSQYYKAKYFVGKPNQCICKRSLQLYLLWLLFTDVCSSQHGGFDRREDLQLSADGGDALTNLQRGLTVTFEKEKFSVGVSLGLSSPVADSFWSSCRCTAWPPLWPVSSPHPRPWRCPWHTGSAPACSRYRHAPAETFPPSAEPSAWPPRWCHYPVKWERGLWAGVAGVALSKRWKCNGNILSHLFMKSVNTENTNVKHWMNVSAFTWMNWEAKQAILHAVRIHVIWCQPSWKVLIHKYSTWVILEGNSMEVSSLITVSTRLVPVR